jgi:MscS family membrane protein
VAVGPHSLDLEIFAYVKTSDWNEFLAIREKLFMRILREVEEAGTALAPPIRTATAGSSTTRMR